MILNLGEGDSGSYDIVGFMIDQLLKFYIQMTEYLQDTFDRGIGLAAYCTCIIQSEGGV